METTDSTKNLIEEDRDTENPKRPRLAEDEPGITVMSFLDAEGNETVDDDYASPPRRNLRSRSTLRSNVNVKDKKEKSPKELEIQQFLIEAGLEGEIPKDIKREDALVRKQATKAKKESTRLKFEGFEDFEELFSYPKGSENIIRMEDYKCLDKNELLTGSLVDFYLQYFHRELMPENMRDRVHIFSSNFYSLYSTKTDYAGWKEDGRQANAKRYERVQGLCPNENIFDKDFIVFPCHDGQSKDGHWFLAIVCFPKLIGSVTFDKGIPVERKEDTLRDPKNPTAGRPVKTSCILVFDSVKGAARKTKAMTHIKNYMESEYLAKYQNDFPFEQKEVISKTVSCPQQYNATDCGLFVTEFVEHFFKKSPITDYRMPIDLTSWFDTEIIDKKREEIANLVKRILISEKGILPELPPIRFPSDKKMKQQEKEAAVKDQKGNGSSSVQEAENLNSSREEDKLNNNTVDLDFNTIENNSAELIHEVKANISMEVNSSEIPPETEQNSEAKNMPNSSMSNDKTNTANESSNDKAVATSPVENCIGNDEPRSQSLVSCSEQRDSQDIIATFSNSDEE